MPRAATPRDPSSIAQHDAPRRLEGWIADHLDGPVVEPNSSPRWPSRSGRSAPRDGRNQLRVEHRGPIAWVRFQADQLVKEGTLAVVERELDQLVEAGCPYLILDFAGVERVSSQFLPILTALQRGCSIERHGRIKLCKVAPDLATALELTGLRALFEVHPDQRAALASPWPASARALPIDVLGELARHDPPGDPPPPTPLAARLLIRREHDGRSATLDVGDGVGIGRAFGARVRIGCPSVSRHHARLRVEGKQIVLDDLGSSNGTLLGARTLRGESATLGDGDTFRVGPLHFKLALGRRDVADEILAAWAAEEASDPSPTAFDQPVAAQPHEAGLVARSCRIEGVLVFTPLIGRFDDDESIDRLREALTDPLEGPEPALRMVFNLAPLGHLPSRAIGVLLAHHLRLRRLGGELRLANACANIAASLAVSRLSELVGCYASVDEAVLSRWDVRD